MDTIRKRIQELIALGHNSAIEWVRDWKITKIAKARGYSQEHLERLCDKFIETKGNYERSTDLRRTRKAKAGSGE